MLYESSDAAKRLIASIAHDMSGLTPEELSHNQLLLRMLAFQMGKGGSLTVEEFEARRASATIRIAAALAETDRAEK